MKMKTSLRSMFTLTARLKSQLATRQFRDWFRQQRVVDLSWPPHVVLDVAEVRAVVVEVVGEVWECLVEDVPVWLMVYTTSLM